VKFLCVPCDEAMKLIESKGPDNGSVSLVYGCEACGYEMAMLTNAHETQLVTSLGVQIGKDGKSEGDASKCPFTGMMQEMTDEAPAAGVFQWTAEAEQRLETIPAFIRPMAKSGIEKFAKDKGYPEVDETVLAEARSHFGM
jgi:hypothetical protein